MRTRTMLALLLLGVPNTAAIAGPIDPLTGLPSTAKQLKRPVLSIMVENTWEARPQSGLSKAGVIVEAYVEGGVTRMIGLFVSQEVDVIGPVRSTRQFFASWVKQFNGVLAHAWAKPTGYQMIRKLHITNIDGVRYHDSISPYFRIKTRKRPHNLYASSKRLRAHLSKLQEFVPTPATRLWHFKGDAPLAQRPQAQYIGLDYHGRTYLAEFKYDRTCNCYRRFLATDPHRTGCVRIKPRYKKLNGAPHSKESMHQLTPKNVVVLFMRQKVVDKGGILEITTLGKGAAMFFIDGRMRHGRWLRAKEPDRYRFVDANGKEVLFNRGQTWISVIDSPKKVSLKAIEKYGNGHKKPHKRSLKKG